MTPDPVDPPPIPRKPADASVNFQGLRSLPLTIRYPIIAGAVAGVLLRLMFSGPAGSSWSAMTGWFIFLAPVVVGMVTVYLAERQYRRSWHYYFMASLIATMLFVAGTLLILVEGLICAVVIVPMFAMLGVVGGLIMGAICRFTRWPKHSLYCFAALPMLLALVGSAFPPSDGIGKIERSVLIHAPVAVVWRNLNDIRDIAPAEMEGALARRIGVPMPMSGTTRHSPNGWIRESRWGSQVHFDEVMQAWEPERYMRFNYRFAPDSFPRAALDDHVVIGGHYFDLLDTEFLLEPKDDGTQLTTRVRYRISTHFNFYADWAAQLLIGNLNEYGLRLYANRSEREWRMRATTDQQQAATSRPGTESRDVP